MTLCEIDTSKMYNMHKKCIVEDTAVTLCEIDTSKMYNNKKCLIVEDITMTLCEIHIHLRCIMCITSVM